MLIVLVTDWPIDIRLLLMFVFCFVSFRHRLEADIRIF